MPHGPAARAVVIRAFFPLTDSKIVLYAHYMSAYPRGKAELTALIASGTPVDYLLFWGHRAAVPGVADKSCLSQWWPGLNLLGFALMEVRARLKRSGS